MYANIDVKNVANIVKPILFKFVVRLIISFFLLVNVSYRSLTVNAIKITNVDAIEFRKKAFHTLVLYNPCIRGICFIFMKYKT